MAWVKRMLKRGLLWNHLICLTISVWPLWNVTSKYKLKRAATIAKHTWNILKRFRRMKIRSIPGDVGFVLVNALLPSQLKILSVSNYLGQNSVKFQLQPNPRCKASKFLSWRSTFTYVSTSLNNSMCNEYIVYTDYWVLQFTLQPWPIKSKLDLYSQPEENDFFWLAKIQSLLQITSRVTASSVWGLRV